MRENVAHDLEVKIIEFLSLFMAHWSSFCLRKSSGFVHQNIIYQLVIKLGPCKLHQNSFFTGRAWENFGENGVIEFFQFFFM